MNTADIHKYAEFTGDLTELAKVVTLTEVHHNWVKFTFPNGMSGTAQVFCEGSMYGINDGRVSRMQILDSDYQPGAPRTDHCLVNYDRGWDVRPLDSDARKALNDFLEALGDDPVGDLTWVLWDTGEYHCASEGSNLDEAADDCAFVPFEDRDLVKVTLNKLRAGQHTTEDKTGEVLEQIKHLQRNLDGDDITLPEGLAD